MTNSKDISFWKIYLTVASYMYLIFVAVENFSFINMISDGKGTVGVTETVLFMDFLAILPVAWISYSKQRNASSVPKGEV